MWWRFVAWYYTVSDIADKIVAAGFEILCVLSSGKDRVLMKIRAPLFLLKGFADHIDYALELEPEEVKATAKRGWTEHDALKRKNRSGFVDPSTKHEYLVHEFEISHDTRFSKIAPYDHIHGKYDQEQDLQNLYKREPGLSHPFNNLARIKLILLLLESHGEIGARLDPLVAMKMDSAIQPA